MSTPYELLDDGRYWTLVGPFNSRRQPLPYVATRDAGDTVVKLMNDAYAAGQMTGAATVRFDIRKALAL